MELANHRVPAGITSGNMFRRNGGQAIEAGLRAVQVRFGDRAIEGVQGRRRDDSTGTASWQQTKRRRRGSSPISSPKCASSGNDSFSSSSARRGNARGEGSLPPQRVDRQVAGGAVKPAARVFRHAAPRPAFQGLHERGLNDALDELEPAHAERTGQQGDKPAELVAKEVLHQRVRFAHV